MTKQVLFMSCEFEEGYMQMTGSDIIYCTPIIAIATSDEINVNVVVEYYDTGNPISVQHGEDEIGTITTNGPCDRPFTAASDTNLIRLVSTGDHRIRFVEVSRDV